MIAFVNANDLYLIIVNDGSKDETLNILKEHEGSERFAFYSHKVNRGYGGAIKTGIRNAVTEYVITIDADGQHDLSDVIALHEMIINTDADMIVGSRLAHKDASLYRGIGKGLIRSLFNIPFSYSATTIRLNESLYVFRGMNLLFSPFSFLIS